MKREWKAFWKCCGKRVLCLCMAGVMVFMLGNSLPTQAAALKGQKEPEERTEAEEQKEAEKQGEGEAVEAAGSKEETGIEEKVKAEEQKEIGKQGEAKTTENTEPGKTGEEMRSGEGAEPGEGRENTEAGKTGEGSEEEEETGKTGEKTEKTEEETESEEEIEPGEGRENTEAEKTGEGSEEEEETGKTGEETEQDIPEFTVEGYENEQWTNEDVVLKIISRKPEISGIIYNYITSEKEITDWNTDIAWQQCREDNQIKISCKEGKQSVTYVYIKAVSAAGKESDIINYMVKIDKKKPDCAALHMEKADGTNGWYQTIPKLELTAPKADEGSKIFTFYKLYLKSQEEKQEELPEILFDGSNQPEIQQDGCYVLEYYTRDEAGNQSKTQKKEIFTDTTAPDVPKITFTAEHDPLQLQFVNFLTFGYVGNETIHVHIESNDVTSQVKEIHYQTIENGKASQEQVVQGKNADFALPVNFQGTVSAYAVDEAGNISDTGISEGVIYEATAPVITITSDAETEQWQNQDIHFQVTARDSQSGLKSVAYMLNGRVIYEKNFKEEASGEITYIDTQEVTASEEAYDTNGYQLEVQVVDNAGNTASKTEHIRIDKTAPVVTLEGMKEAAHYNETKNLTIGVKEQIFQENTVTISATRQLDGVTERYEVGDFQSDGCNSKNTFSFSEEGFYQVTVSAEDAAGNSSGEKKISFTIDKTAPQITIKGPEDGSCQGTDVRVQIGVEESFYDTNQVTIEVTRSLDGQTSVINFGEWKNQEKKSQLSHLFSEDGTYMIAVHAEDAAGNEAKVQQLSFIVDKTAPKISINGAGDYDITSRAVTLSFEVTESYFDTNQVFIEVQKEDAEGNMVPVETGAWVNSGKESSLSLSLEEDGVYLSVVKARDRAGNEAEARKIVTVDTTDPVIRYVEEMDGRYYQTFQLSHELGEMVEDLTVPTVEMYLNSDEYDGETEITKEGKYVFRMEVSDEAGHKSTAKAQFVVDHTPPEIVFMGAEDGAVLYDDVALDITLANPKDWIQEIRIDGETQKLDGKRTNLFQTSLSQLGEHQVEIAAIDLAGNMVEKSISFTIAEQSGSIPVWNSGETAEQEEQAVWTGKAAENMAGNTVEKKTGNKMIYIGLPAAIVAAAAVVSGGAAAVSRKRKKKLMK